MLMNKTNVKSESKNKKRIGETSIKLAKLDWNNMLMNKTVIECWNILKYEIESIGLERNTCQKKLLEK